MRRIDRKKPDHWLCRPPPSAAPHMPEDWASETIVHADSARHASELYIDWLFHDPAGMRLRNVQFDMYQVVVRPYWGPLDVRTGAEPHIDRLFDELHYTLRKRGAPPVNASVVIACSAASGATWDWVYEAWWGDTLVVLNLRVDRDVGTRILLTARPDGEPRGDDLWLNVYDGAVEDLVTQDTIDRIHAAAMHPA